MIEIDGSGGGGQLVRTALSLSALSGRPVRVHGVRGNRPNPGLRPQHLAALRAMTAITDAEVSETEEGSESFTFEPDPVQPGHYEVDVGTAGSVTLLFDAVLPLACTLDGALRLRAVGGTDVKWAPSFDYFRRVKLPLLRRYGLAGTIDLDRRGFYPAGGGVATLSLAPSTVDPLNLPAEDSSPTARVYSVASDGLGDRRVAERQAEAALAGLAASEIDVVERIVEYAAADSPGSVLTIRLDRDGSILGTDALGERGKSAESVADEAVGLAHTTMDRGAAVDEHLADQLLVFLAVVGGRVSIPSVTAHVETSRSLLEQFGYDVRIDGSGECPVVDA